MKIYFQEHKFSIQEKSIDFSVCLIFNCSSSFGLGGGS
jgi:hypothetical protein